MGACNTSRNLRKETFRKVFFRCITSGIEMYRKNPKISPGADIFQMGLIYGGKFTQFQIDWANLIVLVESKLTLFFFVLLSICGRFSKYKLPGVGGGVGGIIFQGAIQVRVFGSPLWGGGGLIHGGAYFRNFTVFKLRI